jgi:hypothetical protein
MLLGCRTMHDWTKPFRTFCWTGQPLVASIFLLQQRLAKPRPYLCTSCVHIFFFILIMLYDLMMQWRTVVLIVVLTERICCSHQSHLCKHSGVIDMGKQEIVKGYVLLGNRIHFAR